MWLIIAALGFFHSSKYLFFSSSLSQAYILKALLNKHPAHLTLILLFFQGLQYKIKLLKLLTEIALDESKFYYIK